MTTLIINIDRDNDYGEKAGVKGPVIGYSQCYSAAVKLITADPEDSDANALFGTLKHYESLQSKGEDVDIALLTGDDDVGEKSDEIISSQLDQMFSSGKYKDAILISDGAEDDYVIPLILSRTKIRYVKHIIVRHNQNIESLYYYIVKAMKDKKLIKKIFIPVGLLLLVYGVSVLSFVAYFDLTGRVSISPSLYALTLVIVVLGAYFIERGFDIKAKINKLLNDIKAYSAAARVMFISLIVSFGLIFVGLGSTYSILYESKILIFDRILLFVEIYSLWIYASIVSRALFKIADIYIGGSPRSDTIFYAIPFSLSAELLVFGIIGYIRYTLKYVDFAQSIGSVTIIIVSIVIALVTSAIYRKKTFVKGSRGLHHQGR